MVYVCRKGKREIDYEYQWDIISKALGMNF